MRSHHKPVLEVEREVYWDFNSNSAEGQKAFESRRLEFPKVLSLTIIINVIMVTLMNTHAHKITCLFFSIYDTTVPKGKGKDHPITGHGDPEGSRGIALFFL